MTVFEAMLLAMDLPKKRRLDAMREVAALVPKPPPPVIPGKVLP